MARITNYDTNRLLIEEDPQNVYFLSKEDLTVRGQSAQLVLANKTQSFSFNFSDVSAPLYPTLTQLVSAIQGYLDEFVPEPTKRIIRIRGQNPDVDDVYEDCWEVGGNYVFPPAGGIQMRVVSTNANDTAAGTGVRQVEIHYLDANYIERDEEITLNGTTPVNTVATNILRLNSMHAIDVGSSGFAVGTINLQNTAGTVTYCRISPNKNTFLQAIYTVPKNKKLEVASFKTGSGSPAGGRYCEFLFRSTAHDDEGNIEHLDGVFHIWDITASQDNDLQTTYIHPMIFPEKTDVKVTVKSDAVIANAVATAYIEAELKDA